MWVSWHKVAASHVLCLVHIRQSNRRLSFTDRWFFSGQVHEAVQPSFSLHQHSSLVCSGFLSSSPLSTSIFLPHSCPLSVHSSVLPSLSLSIPLSLSHLVWWCCVCVLQATAPVSIPVCSELAGPASGRDISVSWQSPHTIFKGLPVRLTRIHPHIDHPFFPLFPHTQSLSVFHSIQPGFDLPTFLLLLCFSTF